MQKKLSQNIDKLERLKQTQINKQAKLSTDIENTDAKIKKLNSFKKTYEKLETDLTEFLNNM